MKRVVRLAQDQLSKIDPEHYELRINMIGAIKEISTLRLNAKVAQNATRRHYKQGNEDLTLHDLWSYCQTAPPSKVWTNMTEIHELRISIIVCLASLG